MERVECHGSFARCELQNISHSSQVQGKLNTLYGITSLKNSLLGTEGDWPKLYGWFEDLRLKFNNEEYMLRVLGAILKSLLLNFMSNALRRLARVIQTMRYRPYRFLSAKGIARLTCSCRWGRTVLKKGMNTPQMVGGVVLVWI